MSITHPNVAPDILPVMDFTKPAKIKLIKSAKAADSSFLAYCQGNDIRSQGMAECRNQH